MLWVLKRTVSMSLFPYFVYVNIEGSDETEQLHIHMTWKTWIKPLPH